MSQEKSSPNARINQQKETRKSIKFSSKTTNENATIVHITYSMHICEDIGDFCCDNDSNAIEYLLVFHSANISQLHLEFSPGG